LLAQLREHLLRGREVLGHGDFALAHGAQGNIAAPSSSARSPVRVAPRQRGRARDRPLIVDTPRPCATLLGILAHESGADGNDTRPQRRGKTESANGREPFDSRPLSRGADGTRRRRENALSVIPRVMTCLTLLLRLIPTGVTCSGTVTSRYNPTVLVRPWRRP
jgi:hypothetical protein